MGRWPAAPTRVCVNSSSSRPSCRATSAASAGLADFAALAAPARRYSARRRRRSRSDSAPSSRSASRRAADAATWRRRSISATGDSLRNPASAAWIVSRASLSKSGASGHIGNWLICFSNSCNVAACSFRCASVMLRPSVSTDFATPASRRAISSARSSSGAAPSNRIDRTQSSSRLAHACDARASEGVAASRSPAAAESAATTRTRRASMPGRSSATNASRCAFCRSASGVNFFASAAASGVFRTACSTAT